MSLRASNLTAGLALALAASPLAAAHAGLLQDLQRKAQQVGGQLGKKAQEDAARALAAAQAQAKREAEQIARRFSRQAQQVVKVGQQTVTMMKTHARSGEALWNEVKGLRLPLMGRWGTVHRAWDLSAHFQRYGVLVKNQGATTTCMANATAAAMEYMIIGALWNNPALTRAVTGYATPKGLQLSRRHIYWYSRAGLQYCDDQTKMWGSWGAQAASHLAATGTFEDKVWPFQVWDPYRNAAAYRTCMEAATNGNPPAAKARYFIREWAYLPGVAGRLLNDHSSSMRPGDLKGLLAHGYPVVLGVFTMGGDQWDVSPQDGMVKVPDWRTMPDNAHYITLVGYDDARAAFKFVNSWGPSWGQQGYGWLPYAYVERYVIEGLVIRSVTVR